MHREVRQLPRITQPLGFEPCLVMESLFLVWSTAWACRDYKILSVISGLVSRLSVTLP